MILHLNTAHTWRGGEQQLFYLAQGLKKRKINQLVIGQPGSELEKRCIADKIPFQGVKIRNEIDFFAVRDISAIIKKEKVRLVHAHTAKAHTIGLLLKRKNPSVNLVVSRRVDFHINKNILSRWKYHSALNDIFLTVSNRIRDVLIEDGIDPGKTITVYSGIDLDRFNKLPSPAKIRKEFSIAKDTIIIGNIAALVDHKDQKTMLQAVAEIKPDNNFVFMIVGEGELEKELKELAANLGVADRVIFTGFRTDITAMLALFDIFTLTSKEEGLGTTVLDAMASGLPVIATRGGGIAEMLEPGGSFLAEVGDYRALAEYYTRLIADKKTRAAMGRFNKTHVKNFSVKNTIDKTLKAYRLFLGKELK